MNTCIIPKCVMIRSQILPKLAITSPTSGGHSVGVVRSRTQTMELKVYKYYGIVFPKNYVMWEVSAYFLITE
jgi:hypothetical protein